VTFERTADYALIKSIITHPEIYPLVADDFSPRPEFWEPIQNDEIWYVLAKEDKPLGLFALIPDNKICWKAHPCLLPETRGKMSREITKQFVQWLWQNTPCRRLIAEIPEFNRVVIKYAVDCGMTQFGVNEKSLLKGGILHDQVMLGISRPKELTWA